MSLRSGLGQASLCDLFSATALKFSRNMRRKREKRQPLFVGHGDLVSILITCAGLVSVLVTRSRLVSVLVTRACLVSVLVTCSCLFSVFVVHVWSVYL